MEPFNVLTKPVLSEKSLDAREGLNKYVFRVNLKATKDDIKRAVVKVFGVKPLRVHTIVNRGKVRRRGAHVGAPTNFKKAIVTLKEGEKIKLFEDQ